MRFQVLVQKCNFPKCKFHAPFMIVDEQRNDYGNFCKRHAQERLMELQDPNRPKGQKQPSDGEILLSRVKSL